MSNPTKQLEDFLGEEWIKHGHSFQDALREVIRYSQFLEVIKARVESASKEYIRLMHARMNTKHSYEILTKEDKEQVDALVHHALLVQLEIESFYLFSKIYLDTTTRFLEVYFGQFNDFRFESFEKLFQTNAAIWKYTHILKFEPDFREVIQRLLPEIVSFRGKKITHPQLPGGRNLVGRRSHALTWKSDGSGSVSLTAGLSTITPAQPNSTRSTNLVLIQNQEPAKPLAGNIF